MAKIDKFYSRVLHTLLRRRGYGLCLPLERRYMRTFNELFIIRQDSFSIKRLSPLNRHSGLRQAQFKMSAEIVPFLSCLVTNDKSNDIIPNPQMRTKDCRHHLTTPPHATHGGAAMEIWDLLISDRYFSYTSPITEMIDYLLF